MVSKLTHLLATKCAGVRLTNCSSHPEADSDPNCVIRHSQTKTKLGVHLALTGWNRPLKDGLWIPNHSNYARVSETLDQLLAFPMTFASCEKYQ